MPNDGDIDGLHGVESNERALRTDKSDRATNEGVLDPRTRLILFKWIRNGELRRVDGCISTGKEANVYFAESGTGESRAIKIYKTSILVFRDREKYVSGEFRFRHGYTGSNPRKMVKLWAEKEMRNLKRLINAGIPCPEPLMLKNHVLVMQFIGDSMGRAAPRLKDTVLTDEMARKLYRQILQYIRILFHDCRLVHADLSEYNILVFDDLPYLIDVSQSVEHDHPYSLQFLREDIHNISHFFRRVGVDCLSDRAGFAFVTDSNNIDLDNLFDRLYEESQRNPSEEVDDHVFRQAYIPQTLEQVPNVELDTIAVGEGRIDNLLYKNLLHINSSDSSEAENSLDDESSSESSPSEYEEIMTDEEEELTKSLKGLLPDIAKPKGHRFEDKDEKRERKKQTKEEARERRKNKMPKKEKKALIKKRKRR